MSITSNKQDCYREDAWPGNGCPKIEGRFMRSLCKATRKTQKMLTEMRRGQMDKSQKTKIKYQMKNEYSVVPSNQRNAN